MATMFGMYPFLMKLYADGGYQGPLFRRAVAKIVAQVHIGSSSVPIMQRHLRSPEAAGCRTNVCMARVLQTPHQRLGESQS